MYGPASNLPSLIQPVPKDWECIDGEFVMVQASYQTHIENECFIVPSAKLSDGVIWLMLVRGGTSRSQMLQVCSVKIQIFTYFTLYGVLKWTIFSQPWLYSGSESKS